jgi:cytochrome P450
MADIDFDHNAPEMVHGLYKAYGELRGQCPVAHSRAHGGYWVLSRYEDVFQVARDDITFSSQRSGLVPPTDVGRLLPIQADPPDLERYRALLNPYFSREAAAGLEPFILKTADWAIDQFIERGRADLVTELANPVPAAATMHLLGLDPSGWRAFAEPLHDVMYSLAATPENKAAQSKVAAFTAQLVDEIDARIAHPRDDMISALLRSDYKGIKTTRDEVIDLVRMVIFGGMDTVVAALSNVFVQLGKHPDIRARLLADRELLQPAVEEFLRYEAPIQGFARYVTKDVTVGGCEIKQGETVFMLWGSANRDEKVFGETSEQLVIDRQPNRHMTFGIGGHRCLGSTMARVEMRIVLGRILDRLPDFEIDWDGVVHAQTVGSSYGRPNVPATFTPGRRLSG